MLGTHREIWPKERQPSCQVLVFPGKSNWEHWRGWENPSIHRTVNCWKTHNAPKSIHILKCLANVWLYLCPQSVRNSEGPIYNLHTFISLAMSRGCRLHSCPMLRGEVFLAWTPIDDHRFGLTSAYWGLTIRSTRVCDRNETMGREKDQGWNIWCGHSSFTFNTQDLEFAGILLGGSHGPYSHSSSGDRKNALLMRECVKDTQIKTSLECCVLIYRDGMQSFNGHENSSYLGHCAFL